MTQEEVIEKITKEKCVDYKLIKKYFKDQDFMFIRNWLKEHEIDPHTTLCFEASNVIPILNIDGEPKKVILQIRSSEKNRIGLFGGAINNGETSIQAALRELREETGMVVSEKDLHFLEMNKHELIYTNSDKTQYNSYVYTLILNEYPSLKLDNESGGIIFISKDKFNDFIFDENIEKLQIHKHWCQTIKNILFN